MDESTLKIKTARSVKWNVIDRVSAQVLYAITGIILARELSQEEFGLVGAVMVFQAFASLLVDSGFSSALIQRKSPTQQDYSTVLWFNLSLSAGLYLILFFSAPLIAACFQGDERIIPLSRVMFLTLILNASSIVQVNRLMKQMNVRMVAISNTVGLLVGGIIGIWMAYAGYGAWAIVWQSIALYSVKSAILWVSQRWMPSAIFSMSILRSYFNIGSRMMITSFLNTLFLNIYSFFIGNRVGMASLGYYTQSDKWSKMGIMSLSQVLTSSFVPALSAVQDQRERFKNMCAKMNRFTAYIVFPAFFGLIIMAQPIFHGLFGTKWDPSVILFQLLLIRGIFTVFIGYYNNVLLALGKARIIMWMEVLRDSVALIALVATLPYLAESRQDNIVWGLEILLYGQLAASALTWIVTLFMTARATERGISAFLIDKIPYFVLGGIAATIAWLAGGLFTNPFAIIAIEVGVGSAIFFGISHITGSVIQREVFGYVLGRFKTPQKDAH